MPEVLSAFDVFVLSSHDEGMSNAILEAMAMERPVVATDVGGTGEVVDEGLTGHLVPARDAEAAGAGRSPGARRARAGARDGGARAPGGRRALFGASDGAADGRAVHATAGRREAGQPATAALSTVS